MPETSDGRTPKRWGWVETLVVIAIGAILVALLLPPAPLSRGEARRTQCKHNLRQIGIALHNYAEAFHGLPEAIADSGNVPRSWRVDLLPYVDQGPLRKRYVDAEAWESEANRPIAETSLAIYRCPSSHLQKNDRGQWFASYAASCGSHATFSELGRSGFPKSIPDGLGQTLLVVEACDQRIVWTEPRDVDPEIQPVGINRADPEGTRSPSFMSSEHTGGAHVTLADGAVRFLPQNLDPKVLKALVTIDGGENISDADF